MVWGEDDCALWAIEPLRRVMSYDAGKLFRGRYKTKRGAGRVLGRSGLAGAMRASARLYAWKKIKPLDAQPGDLGLVTIGGVHSMATCRKVGWFVARNEMGFTGIEAKHVKFAWAVI
jgi:hypothetical protein